MSRAVCSSVSLMAAVCVIAVFAAVAQAQQASYPKPTELPNPYHLVEGWPTLPASMNGGHWGAGWGHGGLRHGFRRDFGFGGLYAYAPYTYGYCNPYDPYAYAYGACNGYSYSW